MQAYIGQGDGSRWTLPQRSSMVDASAAVPDPLLDEPEKAGIAYLQRLAASML